MFSTFRISYTATLLLKVRNIQGLYINCGLCAWNALFENVKASRVVDASWYLIHVLRGGTCDSVWS